MEAAVANLLSSNDKALIVVGGSFGRRFSELCDIHGVPHDDVIVPMGKTLISEVLSDYDQGGYSALLVNIHETSTGVLYDAEMLSDFCKKKIACSLWTRSVLSWLILLTWPNWVLMYSFLALRRH